MNLRPIVLALSLALAGAVQASDYPAYLAQVDAALAEKPQLDDDVLKEIQELRAEGEKQKAAGKDDKAVEAIVQALLLLGKL